MSTSMITGQNKNGDLSEAFVNENSLAVISGGYKDLGLVIDATNMAAGATVYSNWFDNVEWVRNMLMLSSSDQNYDIQLSRRDTSLTADMNYAFVSGATANALPKATPFSVANNAVGCALLGYSCRFGFKNVAGAPNTYGKLRVQLMGL